GQLSLQLQRVNLVSLTQQVIEQQRPTAGDRDLLLESEDQELDIVCDPLRIRQVLTNLVGNAIRYSPPGTTVCVALRTERADRLAALHSTYASSRAASPKARHGPPGAHELLAVLLVQDQGAGISDEQLARVFNRYSRGSELRGEGLGLGLYLSREFVM